ncbi:MAG TPA: hypothetical protein VN643_15390 [Pyrinomonadaceae bacterium]|nr:hypothetical protein [Pyrinomonadaceae bacterium]
MSWKASNYTHRLSLKGLRSKWASAGALLLTALVFCLGCLFGGPSASTSSPKPNSLHLRALPSNPALMPAFQVFEATDSNNDGLLTTEEHGTAKARQVVLSLLTSLDLNQDGTIQPAEMGAIPEPARQFADKNCDDLLQQDELYKWAEESATRQFAELDRDADQRLTFAEFSAKRSPRVLSISPESSSKTSSRSIAANKAGAPGKAGSPTMFRALFDTSKVKTTSDNWRCLDCRHDDTCNCGYVTWKWINRGFNPPPVAHTLSPIAADPRVRTAEPMLHPTGPWMGCRDKNSDGWCDMYYDWRTNSLLDVGTFLYHPGCTYTDDKVHIFDCDPKENTLDLTITNQPPSVSTTMTGTQAIGNSITFNASGTDPDGGPLTYRWRIDLPATHAATLTTPNSSSVSLRFIDERDISPLWKIVTDVDDDEGERITFSNSFSIRNLPPVIAINGLAPIDALQPIALAASTTTDPDGGPPLTLRWDILQSPPGASLPPQNDYGGGAASINIPTLDRDIGTWRFKLTARDNEMEEATALKEVIVRNLPPKITLSTPASFEIDEGRTISVANTTPDDPDGGAVTHDWELIQAPVAAGATPGPSYATGPTLSVSRAQAGTWIFKLHATDNDHSANSEATQEVQVLVDGPATANVTGPERNDVFKALSIDGSASLDTDSPPVSVLNRGHVTSRPPPVISPGIVSYQWSLVEVPVEYFPRYIIGPVEYSLDVTNNTPKLNVGAGALRPGSWTFQLEVTDGEGNVDTDSYTVLMLEPNSSPVAILPPQRFFLTDVSGVTPAAVTADASASFDLDNLLHGPYSPGLGITNYSWRIINAPALCTTLPTPPSGASANTFELYPAGTAIPLGCHGGWTVGVTITDDEMPGLTASGDEAITIGNCVGEICIDYPTTANYKYVEFADNTDVTIYYHLNSALYANPIFSGGARAELALFHESSLTLPVYTGQFDYDPLMLSLGGYPAVHWHGFTNFSGRPRPGKYTIRMRVTQPLLASPFSEAVQSEAIWLEVVDVAINRSDTQLSLNRLESGADRLHLEYSISGHFSTTPVIDEAFLHIRSVASPATIIGSIPIPSPASGSFDWTGELAPGTQVSPGEYTAEIEVRKLGHSLGTSHRKTFTAYRIKTQVAGTPDADRQTPGAVIPINTSRNLTVSLEPSSLAGSVVLRTTSAGNLEVKDGATVLNTDASSGVVMSSSNFATPKTFAVKALKNTSTPTRFEAVLTPSGAATGKNATDFVNIHGLDLALKPGCADSTVAEASGIFVQRNPVTVTPANFEQLKYAMQPLTIVAQPVVGRTTTEVSLEYETGSASVVTLREASGTHALVSLPRTWRASDFDPMTHRLEVPLLANGDGSGEAILKLRYRADGVEVAVRRVKVRVGDLPGLAGSPVAAYPFFLYGRVVNAGSVVNVALDPSRFVERVGRRAAVYVVAHKTAAAWAADSSLVPVVPPVLHTLAAGSIAANVVTISGVPEGSYDVIYDFGSCPSDPATFTTDGRLDPGDLIDSIIPEQPSLVVVPSTLAAGAAAISTSEYGTGVGPATTSVAIPYDDLASATNFRLRGRLIYPSVIPAGMKLPLVVFAHGRHIPLMVNTGMGFFRVDSDLTGDENYRGYTYLQEHLARLGYATLSVDLDETFGLSALGYPAIASSGIRLRAYVMLRNIEEVISNPAIAGGALSGKINTSRIFLIGHSRGAEAVLVAWSLLSGTTASPPGAAPYTLAASAIKGIVSIAPVSAENPALAGVPPYLLIYGSADGDVNGAEDNHIWPFRHFDRATGPAHLIYAIGACHNYFNSSWPYSDASEEYSGTYVSGSIIPKMTPVGAALLNRSQHQQLATGYITSFLMLYDRGKTEYAAYFSSPPNLLRPSGLDLTVPLSSALHPTPGGTRFVVDDYQSNPSLVLTSSGTAVTSSVASLSEDPLADTNLGDETEAFNRFFQETNGALFQWPTTAGYTVTLPAMQQDLRNSTIALRLGQQPKHALTTGLGGALDFAITLQDAAGNTSTVQASAWHTARGIYPSIVDMNETTKGVLESFTFPWWAFVANGRTLDLNHITSVKIDLGSPPSSAQGRVAIDDLEIWR